MAHLVSHLLPAAVAAQDLPDASVRNGRATSRTAARQFGARASLCLVLAALSAAASHADPVGYYGNTLLIKRASGQGELVYRPDHSFTLKSVAGETIQGTWALNDGKLCLDPKHDKLKPFCVPDDPVHKVGDSWTVRSPQGEDEVLTIVAGQK